MRYLHSTQRNSILAGIAASLLLIGLLQACRPAKHPAATAVVNYLQALVDKDEARFTGLTCKAFESDALLQYDSFSLVQARLENVKCEEQDTGSNTATVTCQGKIIATYGAEDQQFDLSGMPYQVQKEGGDWLVCGQ